MRFTLGRVTYLYSKASGLELEPERRALFDHAVEELCCWALTQRWVEYGGEKAEVRPALRFALVVRSVSMETLSQRKVYLAERYKWWNEDEMKDLIQEYAKNWEFERIALMDVYIMQMALTEALYFPLFSSFSSCF